jgi:hypothetical protein
MLRPLLSGLVWSVSVDTAGCSFTATRGEWLSTPLKCTRPVCQKRHLEVVTVMLFNDAFRTNVVI